jgi:hypothetical protein
VLGHALPHVPQFVGSVSTSTQRPLHDFVPAAQHAPLTHDEPAPHVVSHAPQWAALLVRSTHVEPHFVRPLGQPSRQLPWKQNCESGHMVPQSPQCRMSS